MKEHSANAHSSMSRPAARSFPSWARIGVGWLAAGAVAAAVLVLFRLLDTALADAASWSGWMLAGCIALLCLQGMRRLKAHRSASLALLFHLHLGWLSVLMFFIHAGGIPAGAFHLALWLAFVLAAVSGVIGFGCERLATLRQREWDALPWPLIAQRRGLVAAESADVFRRIAQSGCPPFLAHLYAQRIVPFLAGPRHLWAHWVGSRRPLDDILAELDSVGSSLLEDANFLRLRQLVMDKEMLDRRRALYWLQRGWLFVHVPATAACVVLVLFHVLFVHAFGG